jgi:hypothetical protein
MYSVNDVRQTEMHTAEPLGSEPGSVKIEIATEKLKRYKSLIINQIPAELINAGVNTESSEIHKLINTICNEEELSSMEGIYYCT